MSSMVGSSKSLVSALIDAVAIWAVNWDHIDTP